MGLQLLGLGFTFGGKDAGLQGMLGSINDRLLGIQGALDNIGKTAADKTAPLKDMADSMSDAGKDSLDPMNNSLGELASKGFSATGAMEFFQNATGGTLGMLQSGTAVVGEFMEALTPPSPRTMLDSLNRLREGINLTTGMEAALQALNVQARAIGANFGYTGRALTDFAGRATGLADGLNIGAAEAAGAIRAFDEAGTEFRALGFDSARDVARFTAGFGINADILRNTAMQMTREFGMSTEAVGRVMSAVAAYGQASGDVAGAMGALPEMMEAMRQQASLMGMELEPDRMEAFARQSMGLAAGLFAIGQDSGTARTAAMELTTALIGAQRNFQNLFSGTQSDLDDFTREMAISTGSVSTAFEMMRSGPEGFVEGMVDMVRAARRNGELTDRQLDFVRARLGSVLGEEASARLVNFFRTADDAALASMSTVRDASRDLAEMGREAHRTGRTMAEEFERVQEQSEMAFRSIARADAASFVRDTGRAMRDVTRQLRAAAAAGGPFGDLLHRMSLADQIGGFAFLPEALRGTAMVAGQMGNQINETIGALTSFGGIMDMVGMGVALFTTRVVENRDESETWGEAIAETAGQFADMAVEAIDGAFGEGGFIMQALEAFANFDFSTLFDTGDTGVGGAFARVINRLSQIDWSRILSLLARGFTNLFENLETYAPGMEQTLYDMMNSVFTWVIEHIPWAAIGALIGRLLGQAWDALSPVLMQGLMDLGQLLLDHAPELILATVAIIAGLIIIGLVGALAVGLISAIGGWVAGIGAELAVLWSVWELWGDEITQFFEDTWNGITTWFQEQWDAAVAAFTARFPRMAAAISSAVANWRQRFATFTAWFNETWESVSTFFSGVWSGMTDSASSASSAIMAALQPAIDVLSGWFDTLSGWMSSLGEQVMPVIDALGAGIITAILDPVAAAQAQWTMFSTFFTSIWTTIETNVNAIVARVAATFTNLGTTASSAFGGIMDTVQNLFGNSVNTVVGEDMAATEAVVTETTDAVAAHLQEVLFGATVRALTEGFATAFEQIVEGTLEFSATMAEELGSLATEILDMMVLLYQRIVEGAAIAAAGIDTFVAPMIARLGQLADAQEALLTARADAERLTMPAADTSRAERLADLSADLRAIHDPDWYRNDYRELFITKMNQVVAAVGAASAGGSASVAPDQLRAILDALGETRTRGTGDREGGIRGTRGRAR